MWSRLLCRYFILESVFIGWLEIFCYFRFRIDNTDHIIDVVHQPLPQQYSQINIICPHYPSNVQVILLSVHFYFYLLDSFQILCKYYLVTPHLISMISFSNLMNSGNKTNQTDLIFTLRVVRSESECWLDIQILPRDIKLVYGGRVSYIEASSKLHY